LKDQKLDFRPFSRVKRRKARSSQKKGRGNAKKEFADPECETVRKKKENSIERSRKKKSVNGGQLKNTFALIPRGR